MPRPERERPEVVESAETAAADEVVSNEAVAGMLEQFAEVYGALGDRHRRLAYERAAASVRSAGIRLTRGTTRQEIDDLPNVGPSIAGRVREFLQTGRVRQLEEMTEKRLPRDFHRFVAIPGIGPKLALKLYKEAGVDTLDDLEREARSGKLRWVSGVGERLVERILKEIPVIRAGGRRRTLGAVARPQADRIVERLRALREVVEVEAAGSLRRGKATVGDVDLVAAVLDRDAVIDAFVRLPQVREVLARGEHTRVLLDTGVEADLWVVDPEGWGAALSYATGSREHTLELRRLAQSRGWSVKTEEVLDEHGNRLPAATEEEFYRTLGLEWVPPELRENQGEIQAATDGGLPELVTLADLKGDLHAHTTRSDGAASLDAMVEAAAAMGREYVAITDHGIGLPVPRGLDDEALLAVKREVESREFPIPVLVGVEANILHDGDLGLRPGTLEELDVVVASLHSGLRDPREKVTRRVVDALSTGLVDVLGHPTTRRLPQRPESDLDLERVFEAALDHGVALEVNGSPERRDLPGALARRAKEMGLKFTVDSDAHDTDELANLALGAETARRGWLEKADVVTALPYREFRRWLDGRG